jgi:2-polyprenyl-3-methyl-5-hydroxy-6-metoxy-1,4-benzoquinol methylase
MELYKSYYSRKVAKREAKAYKAIHSFQSKENLSLEWFRNDLIPQSLTFYSELFPTLFNLLQTTKDLGRQLNILDVGAGVGAGTNHLSEIFRGFMSGFKVNFFAIDNVFEYKNASKILYPRVNYFLSDLKDLNSESFDFVISSHVVEHMPKSESLAFVRECYRVSKKGVLIYAPYNEPDELLNPYHLTSINNQYLELLKIPVATSKLVESAGWVDANGSRSCICFTLQKGENNN